MLRTGSARARTRKRVAWGIRRRRRGGRRRGTCTARASSPTPTPSAACSRSVDARHPPRTQSPPARLVTGPFTGPPRQGRFAMHRKVGEPVTRLSAWGAGPGSGASRAGRRLLAWPARRAGPGSTGTRSQLPICSHPRKRKHAHTGARVHLDATRTRGS